MYPFEYPGKSYTAMVNDVIWSTFVNITFIVGKLRDLSFAFRDFEISCTRTDFFILADGLTSVFIRVTDKIGYVRFYARGYRINTVNVAYVRDRICF